MNPTTIPTMGESDMNNVKLSLLRRTRARIAEDLRMPRYICVSLNLIAKSADEIHASKHLRELIHERMNGFDTLQAWLVFMGHVSHVDIHDQRRLQRTRLAWIDALIIEHGGTP